MDGHIVQLDAVKEAISAELAQIESDDRVLRDHTALHLQGAALREPALGP
jgi:hypothetical protein